jgi:SAM-dependent methyltransferase
MSRPSLRQRFVRAVYADQSDSPNVRRALEPLLRDLGGGRGVNVGGGPTRLDPRLVHMDLFARSPVDCVARAEWLPFAPGSFELVVCQETVEHVADPFAAVQEMARVLRPGGRIYLQVPFVIGYHPGPEDYWRFTRAGVRMLLERGGFREERIGISVGSGTGMYRIAVEFLAGLMGRLGAALYHPAKGVASLVCYPLKWFDGWIAGGMARDRIPGGYLAIGVKPDAHR